MKITRAWLRVLFPFRWSTPGDRAFADVCQAIITHADSLWDTENPGELGKKLAHTEYFVEYLPHVSSFLFDATGASGCRYFQVGEKLLPRTLRDGCDVWCRRMDTANRPGKQIDDPRRPTLRHLQLLGTGGEVPGWIAKPPQPDDGFADNGSGAKSESSDEAATSRGFRIRVEPATGVEAWLSRSGAGVVSISFLCQSPTDEPAATIVLSDLVRLVHSLVTAHHAVWFHSEVMSGIGDGEPERADSPGCSDSSWQHIHGWLWALLRPFRSNVSLEFDVRAVAFSALEIDHSGSPDRALTAELDDALSHFAQAHPTSHPGEADQRHSRTIGISRRHRCVLSLNGAAHAAIFPVANAGEYDRNRLRQIQMGYFPGYLLALLQRQCLQHFLEESAAAARFADEQTQRVRYEQLVTSVMRFSLEGEFVQACWRATLQHHHEVAQRVCLVHEGLSTVRAAMSDLASIMNQQFERQQRSAADEAAEARHEAAERSERTMQVLEVFIVTFYSVELAHILGESFHIGHSPVAAWSLVAVALSSFTMASLLISWKWLKQRGPVWTLVALFVMATLIHAGFLGVNVSWNNRNVIQFTPVPATDHKDSERDH